MKKIFFSILMLFSLMASSAWAQTETYLTDGDFNILSGELTKGNNYIVHYSRSFTPGRAATVILPSECTVYAAVGSFYTFTGIDGNEINGYTAMMMNTGSMTLAANTPYLFVPVNDGYSAKVDVTFDFNIYDAPAYYAPGETTVGNWTFKGTYSTQEWYDAPEGIYGFSGMKDYEGGGIYEGEFIKVGAQVRIKPMRCYLEYKGYGAWAGVRSETPAVKETLPETIKVRLMDTNGDVTAIGSLSTKTGEVTFDKDVWYSLEGKRFDSKPSQKGVYVNNGKKVVVK